MKKEKENPHLIKQQIHTHTNRLFILLLNNNMTM